MNKKLFSTLAAGTFTLLSCTDAVVETEQYNSPIETKANLTVKVQDALTGEMLSDGLTVTFPDRVGKQMLPSGAWVFDTVYVGVYNVIASAPGYATVNARVGIGANQESNVHIARENVAVVPIYPIQASLEGFILYENKDNNMVPAKDVAVQLHLGNGYSYDCPINERIYDATATLASGKFVFDKNLPTVGPDVCSYTLYAIGGKTGEVTFQTTKLSYSTNFNLSNGTEFNSAGTSKIGQDKNTQVFVLTNYDEIVLADKRTSPVKFTFSDVIDSTSIEASSIVIVGNTEVADVKWDYKGKTVTLTPASFWNNTFDVKFTGLKSVTGYNLENDDPYTVIVRKTDISKAEIVDIIVNNHYDLIGPTAKARVSIDSVKNDDSQIKISWEKIEGADDGYDIFYKDGTMNNYKKITNINGGEFWGTENGVTAQVDVETIENRTVKILVQAKNSQFKSILADKNALTIFDNMAPFFETEYDTTQVPKEVPREGGIFVKNKNFGAILGVTTEAKVHEIEIKFDEPMDINNPLELTIVNNGGSTFASGFERLDVAKTSFEWTDKDLLVVRIVVKSSSSAATSNLDAKLTIKGLRDENGVDFEQRFNEINSFDSVILHYYTKVVNDKNLDVRILATP